MLCQVTPTVCALLPGHPHLQQPHPPPTPPPTQIDAAPFKQWYQQHYGVEVGIKKKGGAAAATAAAAEGEAAVAQVGSSRGMGGGAFLLGRHG